MLPGTYTITAKDPASSARTGLLMTAHGQVQTPVFMPVGTKGSVKGITKEELTQAGAEIILGNTYHLYLRPGAELVDQFGGLHGFTTWDKPMLTDSGGFQVFSLGAGMQRRGGAASTPLAKISEGGVAFRSYLDGSKHFFSPESVLHTQALLGADIVMAFDECAPAGADKPYIAKSLAMTHRWLTRSYNAFVIEQEQRRERMGDRYYEQLLFPIVQGGVFDDLRKESAQFVADMNMPGNAIGGLSVGETKEHMYRTLEVVNEVLPQSKPRYLMGVGTPEDILEGILRGVDMFDCVLPTRIGRHGAFFTHDGVMDITNSMYKADMTTLDLECEGFDSFQYSRAYIRHLFLEKEMLAMRILSLHNVQFLIRLVQQARQHIGAGTFSSFHREFLGRYLAGKR